MCILYGVGDAFLYLLHNFPQSNTLLVTGIKKPWIPHPFLMNQAIVTHKKIKINQLFNG